MEAAAIIPLDAYALVGGLDLLVQLVSHELQHNIMLCPAVSKDELSYYTHAHNAELLFNPHR